jgi:hypothetical protein
MKWSGNDYLTSPEEGTWPKYLMRRKWKAEIEMAESKVIVQYGELMVEEADADSWVMRGSGSVGTFESLIDALLEFDHRVGKSRQQKAEIVWLSDRFELLSLLGDNGCNTFGANVNGGFVRFTELRCPKRFPPGSS